MDHAATALAHPNTFTVVVACFAFLLGGVAAAWVAAKVIRKEMRSEFEEFAVPLFTAHNEDKGAHQNAINLHNRDEDAHEAAGIKVRKERQAMFDGLRDRIDAQHSELLEAITEVRTNQTQMKESLGEVVKSFGMVARQHEDLERRFTYLQKQHNQLHNRGSDLAGRSFDEVRLNLNLPRRASDPEDEDHREERK